RTPPVRAPRVCSPCPSRPLSRERAPVSPPPRRPVRLPAPRPRDVAAERRRMRRSAAWLVACFLLAGCASTHFENFPLTSGTENPERRAVDVSHEERPLILVAI